VSAKLPLPPNPPQANTAASLMFKSGDLKALHLDRSTSLAFQVKEKNEYEASFTENSTDEHRMKKEKKKNHHNIGNNNNGQHTHNGRQRAHKLSTKDTIVAPCHTAVSGSKSPDTNDHSALRSD
jgi:hypothetical protein